MDSLKFDWPLFVPVELAQVDRPGLGGTDRIQLEVRVTSHRSDTTDRRADPSHD